MVRREVEIRNQLGLHARAAAKFVQLASRFRSEVEIVKGDMAVNGKSIMGVLLLAAPRGSRLELVVEGSDEEEAMAALVDLIDQKFGEE